MYQNYLSQFEVEIFYRIMRFSFNQKSKFRGSYFSSLLSSL